MFDDLVLKGADLALVLEVEVGRGVSSLGYGSDWHVGAVFGYSGGSHLGLGRYLDERMGPQIMVWVLILICITNELSVVPEVRKRRVCEKRGQSHSVPGQRF